MAYFDYLDSYAWYVGTCYTEDAILRPLRPVQFIIALTAVMILAMAIAVAIWFYHMLTAICDG